jgi:hypothetical protein
MFLLLLACTVTDAPSCTDEPIHSCPTVEVLHACTMMGVVDGLNVHLVGGTTDTYDAVVRMDDQEIVFSCNGGQTSVEEVQSCGADSFRIWGFADTVEVTVTTADTTVTDTFEPCWDANEVNGRCCGWSFSADVELAM